MVLLLAIIGFRARKKKEEKFRAKEIEKRKRLNAKRKRTEGMGKAKSTKDKTVAKKIVKSEKQTKALSRLEEDYKAGNLDKEIYAELKDKYLEYEVK